MSFAHDLDCNYLGLNVIYFTADLRMYNRFYVIALGICVRACVYALLFCC